VIDPRNGRQPITVFPLMIIAPTDELQLEYPALLNYVTVLFFDKPRYLKITSKGLEIRPELFVVSS